MSKEKIKLISGAVFTLLLVVASWIVVFNRAFNDGKEYGYEQIVNEINADMELSEWKLQDTKAISINHGSMLTNDWGTSLEIKYNKDT